MTEPGQTRSGLKAAWPWFLLAGALALWVFAGERPAPMPEGEAAPPLSVTTTEGAFELEAQRGHVTVLAFWATWCGACRAEAPVLSRVHQRIQADGDRVVGISVDEMPLERVAAAGRRMGITYPIAVVDHEDVDRFHVQLLPTIYVVGPDGRIASSFTGAVGASTLLDAVSEARGSVVSAR